jgi:hypothetical protein
MKGTDHVWEKQGVKRQTAHSHRPVVEGPVKWRIKFQSYMTGQLTASCGRYWITGSKGLQKSKRCREHKEHWVLKFSLTQRSCTLLKCDAVLLGEWILQGALSSWRGRHYNPHNISNRSPSVTASHPRHHTPQHAYGVNWTAYNKLMKCTGDL